MNRSETINELATALSKFQGEISNPANTATNLRYPKYMNGNKFGEWTILKQISTRKVLCECSCGNTKEVYKTNLGTGKSESCGCLREVEASGTKLYNVWASLKSRCLNKNHHAYLDYGARGITVCDEWIDSVDSFYHWALESGYKEGLTIDRIDNNKGYSPDNCKWSTMEEQHNNKRNNRFITYNGKTQTVAEWARETGINNRTILSRLRGGWDVSELFIDPGGNRDE